MERTKHFTLIFIALVSFLKVYSTNNATIFDAYVYNKMPQWKETIDQMQQQTLKGEQLSELVNYQYGYIAWCLGTERKSEAEKYLDMAEKNIDFLAKTNFDPATTNAYRSAFLGFRIALSKIKAPILGPESINVAKTALEQNPDSWIANVQHANIQFYMPSVFGGSKTEAIEYYLKALRLMERQKLTTQNWNYLNLLVVIAEAYYRLENYSTAKHYLEIALKVEPNFTWVKNELYPKVLKTNTN